MTEVILVDDQDNAVGAMEKMEAHRKALLHRAFSVFIFNGNGQLLLQQRAAGKYHSPGLWTNACCSHPQPGEDTLQAAQRRLQEEMGFCTPVQKIFDFVYKTPFDNGLTEYEFDHVFAGTYTGIILPNPDEVADYCFKSMEEIKETMEQQPHHYTSWFKIAFPMLEAYLTDSAK